MAQMAVNLTLTLLTIPQMVVLGEKLQLVPLTQLAMAAGAALVVALAQLETRMAVLAAQMDQLVPIAALVLVQTLATPAQVKDAQLVLLLKRLALSIPMAGKVAAAMWEMARVEAPTLETVAEARELTTPLLILVEAAVLALL